MRRNVVQNGGLCPAVPPGGKRWFRGGQLFRAVGQVLRQRQQGIAGVDIARQPLTSSMPLR